MENPLNTQLRAANPRFTGMDTGFVPPPEPAQFPHDVVYAAIGLDAINAPVGNEGKPVRDGSTDQGDEPANVQMQETDLIALIKRKVETSHQWYGSGKLSSQRIEADRYYRGELLGNEQEGRSKVVSRDVAESIDGAMPSLMRVFAGGERICIFEPHGPEDEEAAEQATDYINKVFMDDNEGFMVLYTWFKDSLMKKNGIVKAWHETRYKRTREKYKGLTQEQMQALQTNNGVKIQDVEEYQETVAQQDPATGMTQALPITLYNCTVVCTKPEKKVCVMNVPPDEFIIEKRAVSIYSANFLAHRGRRTISDLLECGYDREKVMAIPKGTDDWTQERNERFRNEDGVPYTEDESSTDETMRKVWVTEAYVKCDYDGDGIAEWRMVILGNDVGGKSSILSNEEVDDHPFSDLTPDPEPHKFYGQSLFDKTKDIQDVKTALLRGILDSTYLANTPRLGYIEGQVNLDDLLDTRVGGAVRMKSAGAIVPIPSTLVSMESMQVVSYIDSVKEKRTGISQMSGGLNPNIINSSATGADILNNNNQQRLELMCRVFAESGVNRLFRIMFKLVCMNQDVPRVVRLRNKWVTVNPQDWKDKMDVSATVGIGLGSKQQQASIAMQLLEVDQKIIAMQGGVEGPLVSLDNVYAKLSKLVEAVGWKTPDPYYKNPKDYQPPAPKPPTPEQQLQMVEMKSKTTQSEAQADSAKASALGNIETKKLDYEMKKLDLEIKRIELEALQSLPQDAVARRADNEASSPIVGYSADGQRVVL